MSKFFASLVAAANAQTLKMASISDLHMMPMYDPLRSSDAYCWPDSGSIPLAEPAYFGQYSCDPPTETVRALLSKLSTEHPDLDVVFLTGDYVSHAIAFEPPPSPSYSTSSYTQLLDITQQVAGLMAEYLPNAKVLVT